MKQIACIAALVTLTACATAPVHESPAPLIDTKGKSADELSLFQQNAEECRKIQVKAMPVSFLEAFGSSDVAAYHQRREDKAAAIVRECLRGRGFATLN